MPELTIPEAAARFGLDYSSLRKAASLGRLKARKVGEGNRATYYTTEAAVEEWRAGTPPRKGWPRGVKRKQS
jgi:hypothetical protein